MYGIYNVNTIKVKIFNVKFKTYKILNFVGKNFLLSMASGLQNLCK